MCSVYSDKWWSFAATQHFNILIDTHEHCIEHIIQIGVTDTSPEFRCVCAQVHACVCIYKRMCACMYLNNKLDKRTLQSQYRTESPCGSIASFFLHISLLSSLPSIGCWRDVDGVAYRFQQRAFTLIANATGEVIQAKRPQQPATQVMYHHPLRLKHSRTLPIHVSGCSTSFNFIIYSHKLS